MYNSIVDTFVTKKYEFSNLKLIVEIRIKTFSKLVIKLLDQKRTFARLPMQTTSTTTMNKKLQ